VAQYKDFITIAPRFTRAINLERDADLAEAVDGYVVAASARNFLPRLRRALAGPAGHRAWTLTGPYGSGKSAFALFIANLFGPPETASGTLARTLLRSQHPEAYREFFDQRRTGSLLPGGFCPILVSGTAEPLLPALLNACCRDIRRYWPGGRTPKALQELDGLRRKLQEHEAITSTAVVETLVRIATKVQQSSNSQGILLVIDELGKFLEFAGREPENNDIYILQQLAEATARLTPPGLFLVTILHQAFERYASSLRPSIRDEWSKVQGRFEDVAFQEPAEEVVNLLGHAVRHSPSPLTDALRQRARKLAERTFDLGLCPRGWKKPDFIQGMIACAPLHPLTVLTLARLCQKFGQNQRSLFAFLISHEPYGLESFLAQEVTKTDLPFYCLDRLYDYVAQALGNGLSVGEGATRWAEIHAGLERCATFPENEIRVIKSVGILSAVGAHGELKPSREIVRFVFDHDSRPTNRAIQRLLESSVLVYRKHSHSLALWQGSDVDIEARLREAGRQLQETASLARKLSELWKPRPVVAKRHSFETGTLRYFPVRFTDPAAFGKSLATDADADGLLLYGLPATVAEREQLLELAQSLAVRERPDILFAIPRNVTALSEAVRELELLRWVEANTPELRGDAVARREVRARVALAQKQVAAEIERLFSPDTTTSPNTEWFHRGIRQAVPSNRSLAQLVSCICDAVYKQTPHLRNELLNRRALSSAAAAARRNLIEAMITKAGEPRLGIAGTPPEMSMYCSVLEATNIHHFDGGGYILGAPQGDPALLEVWKAIESFFSGCELQRRSVSELFALLRKPPFGLKNGIIPVLFCATALAHDTEIAFYENGAFIPELTVEVVERLLRSPDRFELRRYRVLGVRREVFRQFAELLGATPKSGSADLVAVVRPLYRFFNRLPQYTRQTKTLSDRALATREALMAAKEPDDVLFEDLPRACGVAPFQSTAAPNEIAVFFDRLRGVFSELQRAYHDLLSELQEMLFRALNVEGNRAREIVRFRADALVEHAVEPSFRAFIHHLADEQLDDVPWIEAIATLLADRPPKTWSDADRARYQVKLSELARTFRHIEALSGEILDRAKSGLPLGEVLRIGVTDRYSKDMEGVVVVETKDQDAVTRAVIGIEEVLDLANLTETPALALAALATTARRFLAEMETAEVPKQPSKTAEARHG